MNVGTRRAALLEGKTTSSNAARRIPTLANVYDGACQSLLLTFTSWSPRPMVYPSEKKTTRLKVSAMTKSGS